MIYNLFIIISLNETSSLKSSERSSNNNTFEISTMSISNPAFDSNVINFLLQFLKKFILFI